MTVGELKKVLEKAEDKDLVMVKFPDRTGGHTISPEITAHINKVQRIDLWHVILTAY